MAKLSHLIIFLIVGLSLSESLCGQRLVIVLEEGLNEQGLRIELPNQKTISGENLSFLQVVSIGTQNSDSIEIQKPLSKLPNSLKNQGNQISIDFSQSGLAEVSIVDIYGSETLFIKKHVEAGTSTFALDRKLLSAPKGLTFISVKLDGKPYAKKVLGQVSE